jgi:hypothetical protein
LGHPDRQGGYGQGIKEITHNRGLTVDELVNELIGPSSKAGRFTHSTCGAKIEAKDGREHMLKVHPTTR